MTNIDLPPLHYRYRQRIMHTTAFHKSVLFVKVVSVLQILEEVAMLVTFSFARSCEILAIAVIIFCVLV